MNTTVSSLFVLDPTEIAKEMKASTQPYPMKGMRNVQNCVGWIVSSEVALIDKLCKWGCPIACEEIVKKEGVVPILLMGQLRFAKPEKIEELPPNDISARGIKLLPSMRRVLPAAVALMKKHKQAVELKRLEKYRT